MSKFWNELSADVFPVPLSSIVIDFCFIHSNRPYYTSLQLTIFWRIHMKTVTTEVHFQFYSKLIISNQLSFQKHYASSKLITQTLTEPEKNIFSLLLGSTSSTKSRRTTSCNYIPRYVAIVSSNILPCHSTSCSYTKLRLYFLVVFWVSNPKQITVITKYAIEMKKYLLFKCIFSLFSF